MDAPQRQPASPVGPDPQEDWVFQGLGFIEAVALLERLMPGAARVGELDPGRESIRFKHDPSLAFSVSDVTAIRSLAESKARSEGPVYEVTTTFLGLTGAASPIPAYVSEEVLDEDHRPLRDFLDIFHHRLLSQLYRELASLRPWAEQTSGLEDVWSARLLALAGLDVYDSPAPLLPKRQLLRLLPLLARRLRSSESLAVALEDLLREHFDGVRVCLREFAGGWSDVPSSERTQLGIRNTLLGANALLGSRVSDPAGAFEIQLGPLSYDTFKRLLDPQGPMAQVHALVSLWTSDPLEYRVVAVLAAGQVPELTLGGSADGDPLGGRLGRDSWLGRTTQETAIVVYPGLGLSPSLRPTA